MRVAVFSTQKYDRDSINEVNEAMGSPHEWVYFEPRLDALTRHLADGFEAVCVFVNDRLDAEVIGALARGGVKLIALRCAGFNNVDLKAAEVHGVGVVRVPAYSPYAPAEHAVALMMALNRKTHRAFNRVREGNFSLGGLLGFDIHGKTAGVVGTGKIGECVTRILAGLGCTILGYDPYENPACVEAGLKYVTLPELFAASDIITLHCPLTPKTYHLVDDGAVAAMKPGVMLINTGRGGLIDTQAVIRGLKNGQIGYLGLDVYEQEEALFFQDLSDTVIQDDVFERLLTFPNVMITAHQGYFTREALRNIATTTVENLNCFAEHGGVCPNVLAPDRVVVQRPHGEAGVPG